MGFQDEAGRHMRRALRLAERGWGRVAPNPLVGAVVVQDGMIAGEGFHAEYGRDHAEVVALRQAGERARGSTLYVTLEPCSHAGKTPPCTDAILAAGVRTVVFATSDPNPTASGGARVLREAGVEVVQGVERTAADDLNASFLFAHSPGGSDRPWIALKLALTLDARIADASGRSAWISGEEAREEVHRLRAASDAIAVGSGTAVEDDPRLTVRAGPAPRRTPVRVVFDRRMRLPPDGYLVRTAREWPVWIVCGSAGPDPLADRLVERGVRVLRADDLATALLRLRENGVQSMLCEGGASLARALLEAGTVDRMHLFYSPLLLGEGSREAFAGYGSRLLERASRWRRLESRPLGPDTLITLAP